MANLQLYVFDGKNDLLEAADLQAGSVQDDFLGESTKLYFIARYFVAVYESRHGEIPIQVWNEYRNALDHYFRHLTADVSSDEPNTHLYKMEGHLQRAALDVLKMMCHRTQDAIRQEREKYAIDVLRLVDNGQFLIDLTSSAAEAGELFSRAKTSDLHLGSDAQRNGDVLELYLDATFAFDAIKFNLIHRCPDIEQAQVNHDSISGSAKHLSTIREFSIHAIFYTVVFFIGLIVKDPLVNWYNNWGESASVIEDIGQHELPERPPSEAHKKEDGALTNSSEEVFVQPKRQKVH